MRQLLPALVASTALHVAVLAVAGSVVRVSRPSAAAEPAIEIEIAEATPSGKPGQVTQAAALPAQTPHARRRLQTPKRQPVPVAVVPPTSGPAAAEAVPAPVAEAAPAAVTGIGAGALRRPTGSDLDIAAFFERLQRSAQRCSGPRAGEGKVRFCVGTDGAPTEVTLVQSTGNFALDDAALHCVIPGAAPFPRTERCLVVPLRFQ